MDCRSFEDRMEFWVTGKGPPEELEAAESHARHCIRCRILLAFIRGELNLLAPHQQQELTAAILARTGGSACEAVRYLLCSWVDGILESVERTMVSVHLENCMDCADLADTLRGLGEILPEMAALEPPAGFTEEVLEKTSTRSRARPYGRGFDRRWLSLFSRPRFALEAAYVGALILLLAFGNQAVLPRVLAAPRSVVQTGDRLMRETTTLISGHRLEARQSIADFREKGRQLGQTAAGLPNRAANAVWKTAVSFWTKIRVELGENLDPQPQNRR